MRGVALEGRVLMVARRIGADGRPMMRLDGRWMPERFGAKDASAAEKMRAKLALINTRTERTAIEEVLSMGSPWTKREEPGGRES